MERAKVLVTGANSLLGVNTIRALLTEGYAVRGLLRNRATYVGAADSNLELVEGNFTDPHCLEQVMAGCRYVVHCAAKTGQSGTVEAYRQINITATERLIHTAVRCGIRRAVYVGSANMFAYGDEIHPRDESAPIKYPFTESAYARSKFEAWQEITSYLAQIEIMAVCPTFMLGAYDSRPSSGKIIRMSYGKRWMLYPPGGKNFVHVADVARGIVAALQRGENGACYLLANENLSYRDFFRIVGTLSDKKTTLIPCPKWLLMTLGKIGDVLRRAGVDTELSSTNMRILCVKNYYTNLKSVRQLGITYQPAAQAVKDTIAWFRENRPENLR